MTLSQSRSVILSQDKRTAKATAALKYTSKVKQENPVKNPERNGNKSSQQMIPLERCNLILDTL